MYMLPTKPTRKKLFTGFLSCLAALSFYAFHSSAYSLKLKGGVVDAAISSLHQNQTQDGKNVISFLLEPGHQYRMSSEPYHSLETWMEIASRHENLTFLNTVDELVSAVDHSRVPTTYLIADSTDRNVPETVEQIFLIENHPLVRCVFAKNAVYSSVKFNLIPIGPKWQYTSHGHYGEDKESTWRALHKVGIHETAPDEANLSKRTGVLVPNLRLTASRQQMIDAIRPLASDSTDWLTTNPTAKSFTEYLRLLQSHKFVISPPGNGRDCHRHWESLLVGTAPIILRDSALETALSDLPVWWVDSYEEVNKSSYQREAAKLPDSWSRAKVKKLYVEWWETHVSHATCRGT